MKLINGYWTDDNNMWDAREFSQKDAESASKTLVNCQYCTDCHYCTDCDCCKGCDGCTDCRYCRYCRDCRDCRDCYICQDCRNCTDCRYCDGCKGLVYCKGYQHQPKCYMTGRIGSRNDITRFYNYGGRVDVVCGCFKGDLYQFADAVKDEHKYNDEYRLQYMAEIETVKRLWEVER